MRPVFASAVDWNDVFDRVELIVAVGVAQAMESGGIGRRDVKAVVRKQNASAMLQRLFDALELYLVVESQPPNSDIIQADDEAASTVERHADPRAFSLACGPKQFNLKAVPSADRRDRRRLFGSPSTAHRQANRRNEQ